MADALTVLDGLPEGLLGLPAGHLHERLPGPTLLRLPGRRDPPLFASVLLHGNEPVGWEAARQRLAVGGELPRGLWLLIGNVRAAAAGLRVLPGQADFNRVWPGGDLEAAPEAAPEVAMMRAALSTAGRDGLFAAVDFHNNTGLNPHYACVNVLETATLHLATLFSRTVVYFLQPRGVASMALGALCPAVTVECGRPGEAAGVAHAREYLDAALHLSRLPSHPVAAHDLDLFHSVATLRVAGGARFALADGPPATWGGVDLILPAELDRLNFTELPPGAPLGWQNPALPPCVTATAEGGEDVTASVLDLTGGVLRLRRAAMPSMLTRDAAIIRQDCLGYLMERYPL